MPTKSLIVSLCRQTFSLGTALSLLEAQAAVGSIADPLSGEQMSMDEALECNLLDQEMATLLRRAERAVTGFKPQGSDQTISLFQAMKQVRIKEQRHGDITGFMHLYIFFIHRDLWWKLTQSDCWKLKLLLEAL